MYNAKVACQRASDKTTRGRMQTGCLHKVRRLSLVEGQRQKHVPEQDSACSARDARAANPACDHGRYGATGLATVCKQHGSLLLACHPGTTHPHGLLHPRNNEISMAASTRLEHTHAQHAPLQRSWSSTWLEHTHACLHCCAPGDRCWMLRRRTPRCCHQCNPAA